MSEFRKDGYKERCNKQLLDWLDGKPTHNKVDDECCPDFSCCQPSLLAPLEVREVFYKASMKENYRLTERMLTEFLGKMIAALPSKKRVYIAGLDVMRQEVEEAK